MILIQHGSFGHVCCSIPRTIPQRYVRPIMNPRRYILLFILCAVVGTPILLDWRAMRFGATRETEVEIPDATVLELPGDHSVQEPSGSPSGRISNSTAS